MKQPETKNNKDKPLTRRESLEFKPVKNQEIQEKRVDSGEVMLIYYTGMRPWIKDLLKRFGGRADNRYEKKIQLDELGTAVWDLMDGRRTVRQIVREFAQKYKLHNKEAEISVTHFLRILGKRGLIGLK